MTSSGAFSIAIWVTDRRVASTIPHPEAIADTSLRPGSIMTSTRIAYPRYFTNAASEGVSRAI